MNEKTIRALFPAIEKFNAYLNTASVGLMPLTSMRFAVKLLNDLLEFNGSVNSVDYMDDLVLKPTIKEMAKILHASEDEVTISIQTTDALKRALYAIKPPKGKDNIVSLDMEFPTVSCLVKSYARKNGLSVRVVKNVSGRYPVDVIEREINDGTFAVVLSSVQWITGYKVDLKELSRIAKEHDVLLIIDAVQHVGAVDLDVKKYEIDVLAAGGEKWLLNPSVGSGILYISSELLDKVEPYLGLLNMKPPPGTWTPWWSDPNKDPWEDLTPRDDARVLDFGGGPPYLLASTLLGALDLINNIGMRKIEGHNLELKRIIVDAVMEEGLEIIGHEEDKKSWSPITTVKTGLNFEREKKLWEELSKSDISVSHRGLLGVHGIRISPHLYNTRDDVEIFLSKFITSLKKLT